MTPRWEHLALRRIRALVAERKVLFTHKALRELALIDVGLDVEDGLDILLHLRAVDSAGRLLSHRTGEWLLLFKPRVAGVVLYVKLILRGDCVVVSFHPDADVDDPQDEEDG